MWFARRDRRERDLDDEIATHLRMAVEDRVADGDAPRAAHAAVRRQFGNVGLVKEVTRDAWRWQGFGSEFRWLETALWDARLACRSLSHDRAFAFWSLIMLTVGMSANVVVLSALDAVLLKPLPYRNPEQLAVLGYTSREPSLVDTAVPTTSIDAWSESGLFDSVATFTTSNQIVATRSGNHIEMLAGFLSDATLSSLLGGNARVDLGRWFISNDFHVSAPRVVVLSHVTWRDRFGADPDLIGRDVTIGGRSYTVIGVLNSEFRFPSHQTPSLLMPMPAVPPGAVRFVRGIARLRPGVRHEHAELQLRQIETTARDSYPPSILSALTPGSAPRIVPLNRHLAGVPGDALPLATGVAGLVLLLACTNVAALLMAKTVSRRSDLAMRAALGASHGRIVQTILMEVVVLSLIASLAAAFVSATTLPAVEEALARYGSLAGLTLHVPSLMLVFSLMVATVAVCALIPIRGGLSEVAGARQVSPGTVGTRIDVQVRRTLVAGQVAIALSLLVGATLLLNTFWRVSDSPMGFNPRGVFTARVSFIGGGYTPAQRQALTSDLLERLAGVSGVDAAGATTALPLGGQMFGFAIPVEGQSQTSSSHPTTPVDLVTPGYFDAIGTRIVMGRDFDWGDANPAAPVALVNEAFVRDRLEGQPPIGRRLALGGGPGDATITIVGVVKDVANRSPREPIDPHVYRPFAQAAPQMTASSMRLAIRGRADRTSHADAVRQLVAEIAPQAAVYDFAMMPDRLASAVTPERHRATIFGTLAVVAVLLAAVGIYSLLMAFVVQSRREFGLRLALGATGRHLQVLVIKQLAVPMLSGSLVGVVGALAFGRSLAGFLFGIRPTDGPTLTIAFVGFLMVSALAAGVPARRAARVDPMLLLRAE